MRILTFDEVWRMIEIDGQTFAALTFLSGCISDWRLQIQLIQKTSIAPVQFSLDTRAQFLKSLEIIEATAKRLDIMSAAIAARRGFDECLNLLSAPINYDAHRLGRIVAYAEQTVFPFMDELQARIFFTMPPAHASFFSSDAPFGETIVDAFPSASYDIVEAAKCRALSRWTACVMHLMRVLEVGLRALSHHYNVDGSQNWNTILNQVESKSREVGKRTHGEDGEKWAGEAAIHLRFIKNAWRNHAMYSLEKYDEERAVMIFDNTRLFMQHLSLKLTENNQW
ncbi:hypothetical protein GRI33_13220 [Brucella sp. BO3]|uniref:hypothetical protein n=2 Tax=unclassified Brucella TaxID=2632610 RepID=UPI0015F5B7DA|nr:hypothetical protein [Brucella sp. BO3]QMV27907.1 hypothetical protein GRI33_13220 [Brucella sp. BO3]